MITSQQLATETGVSIDNIRHHARMLKIPKVGRDYVFTDDQATAIKARIGTKPGPKRNPYKAATEQTIKRLDQGVKSGRLIVTEETRNGETVHVYRNKQRKDK